MTMAVFVPIYPRCVCGANAWRRLATRRFKKPTVDEEFYRCEACERLASEQTIQFSSFFVITSDSTRRTFKRTTREFTRKYLVPAWNNAVEVARPFKEKRDSLSKTFCAEALAFAGVAPGKNARTVEQKQKLAEYLVSHYSPLSCGQGVDINRKSVPEVVLNEVPPELVVYQGSSLTRWDKV